VAEASEEAAAQVAGAVVVEEERVWVVEVATLAEVARTEAEAASRPEATAAGLVPAVVAVRQCSCRRSSRMSTS